MIVSKQFNVKNYKRLRTKFSTQIADGLFNADEFIKDMKPFSMIENENTKLIQAKK